MRRAVFRVGALLGGLLLALLLGEAVARIVGEPPLAAVVRQATQARGPDSGVIAVDDGRIFAGKPGGTTEQPLDRWGLRDPAEGPEAPCRMILLGDSVAWGHGLQDGQTLGRRLEERLGLRVHTLAFPGWNTAQEAAALEVLGPALRPDLVLVLWVPNDAASVEVEGGDLMYVQRRVSLLPWPGDAAQIALWRRSWLFRRVGDAFGSRDVLLEAEEHRQALARIAATSAGLGAPALLAQVPPLVHYGGELEPWRPGRPAPPYVQEAAWRAAVQAAHDEGFARFDLSAALAGTDPTSHRLTPTDRVHPSAQAVVRFAEALAPWLKAELPGRCGE